MTENSARKRVNCLTSAHRAVRNAVPPARGGASYARRVPETPARPPLVLRVGLLLVLVELAALAALAVSIAVEALGGGGPSVGPSLAMAVFFLGLAGLVAAAARALHAGRRWGRGPVLTWQLLVLAIGVSQAGLMPAWLTVLGVVLPVAVAVAVLAPASRGWTDDAGPHAVL